MVKKQSLWVLSANPVLILAVAISGATTAYADNSPGPEASAPAALEEIVITATRKEEVLSKVPMSVTALTADAMEDRGIKDIQDAVRFTPGVAIDNNLTNSISIRGISSSSGASTTGIYIDDV